MALRVAICDSWFGIFLSNSIQHHDRRVSWFSIRVASADDAQTPLPPPRGQRGIVHGLGLS
jgi:hypothetical protein